MTTYRFLTSWQIEAPLQAVFDVVFDSLHWPDWWQGAERVEQLEEGDASGIGSVRRYTWKSLLPYRLRFDARATYIVPLRTLEATVDGDLQGWGRWTFHHEKGITTVDYEWDVHTTKRWMNMLSPVAYPVFAHNHHVLMHRGAEDLARYLHARLLRVSHIDLPVRAQSEKKEFAARRKEYVDWRVAAVAGLLAGIVATLVQLMLWWTGSYPALEMLLRDSRLAAAIVLSSRVLEPLATLDWEVMLVATLVHVALSAGYGLLQAPIVARLKMPAALVAGIVFGVLLYWINMYGFTAIFPWFTASRDWITGIAHAAFGVSAALIYKLWSH